MVLLKIFTILVLMTIFVQDKRDRKVHWFLFPIMAICCGILFYDAILPELFLDYLVMNTMVISILLFTAYLYTRLKLNVKFNEAFGLGDVLFFIGLIFTFTTVPFLVIFVTALVFSLLMHLVESRKSKDRTVPLAGYMSLYLAMAYMSQWTGVTNLLYAF